MLAAAWDADPCVVRGSLLADDDFLQHFERSPDVPSMDRRALIGGVLTWSMLLETACDDTGGVVQCWGRNAEGQRGHDDVGQAGYGARLADGGGAEPRVGKLPDIPIFRVPKNP